VGNGSFNSTLEIAQNLAHSLVNVAKGAGLECEAILTDMNQVLGRSAGHSLEVIECIEYLTSSKRDSKLETITNELASSILMMIKNISKEESLKQINTVLANGKAAEKFERMINALGGSNSFLSTYKKELSNNTFVQDIYLEKQGWIKEIKTRDLGLLLIELGGGRKQVDDKINYHVGYDNVLGIGECVDSSTPVIKVYANSKDDFNKVKNSIINCFIVSDQEVKETESIYEVIK
jgi:thymidine phosphorylase